MHKSALTAAVFALALVLGLAATQLTRADDAAPAGSDNLEPVMKRMNQSLKTLSKIAGDPTQQAAADKTVVQFESDILAAKKMLPAGLPKDGPDRDTAIASYRSMMMNLLRQALDLEEAIQDKKPDDAAKIIAAIREIEKQGHKEFRKED